MHAQTCPIAAAKGSAKLSASRRKQAMRVAVTGGRGRLGRYVVAALRGAHEVRVLDRTPPRDGADWPAVDMLDRRAVAAALRGQEAVIHLAAIDSSLGAS